MSGKATKGQDDKGTNGSTNNSNPGKKADANLPKPVVIDAKA